MPSHRDIARKLELRAGKLWDDLIERVRPDHGPQSANLVAKRDLARYYRVLEDEMKRISLSEVGMGFVAQALTGIHADVDNYQFLSARVERFIAEHESHWDSKQFLEHLYKLTPGETMALWDWAERQPPAPGAE